MHHSVTAFDGDKEGIPNALIEAMAMELPVLSTYHSGIPELVEHGTHGLLCEERDIDALALQFGEIKSWERKPENRQKVKQQFDIKVHVDRLLKFYKEEVPDFVSKNGT